MKIELSKSAALSCKYLEERYDLGASEIVSLLLNEQACWLKNQGAPSSGEKLALDCYEPARKSILSVMKNQGKPICLQDLRRLTGLQSANVRSTVGRLVEEGLVFRPRRATYALIPSGRENE